jgi:hypothetical protein
LTVNNVSALSVNAGTYYGSVPGFEAVNKKGELLEFSKIVPGDFLKVTAQDEVEISAVEGTRLTLVSGLPSNVESVGFTITGGSARKYNTLSSNLGTFIASPNLLAKNNFDESLDALDVALTAALSPGQAFPANVNQARTILSDLLSTMTGSPRRAGEYSASIPTAALNLESILAPYVVSAVPALDSLILALTDRKYDRAVELLKTGDFAGFFSTDHQTASFSGAVLSTTVDAIDDLPTRKLPETSVDLENQLPVSYTEVPDADESFGDTGFEE